MSASRFDRALDELDDSLVAVRRILQRPDYRRQLIERLGDGERLATMRIVRAVERVGDPCSVGDVAELLAIDPSTASRSVEDSVARGLLVRRACQQDRRKSLLEITEQGRLLLDRMTAVRRQLLAEVTADWEPGEVVELVNRLQRLLAGFDRLEDSV
jgi:DNA-binding MarR family transcriptional regulator